MYKYNLNQILENSSSNSKILFHSVFEFLIPVLTCSQKLGSPSNLTLLTFKSPKSNEYFKVWTEYYEKLKIEIPEGQLGCNPGGISTSDELRIIGTIR